MLRKSKVIFLKAITMGALLANGGIGTEGDDDKQRKNLDVPLYQKMIYKAPTETSLQTGGLEGRDVHRSLIEPRVNNILTLVDERAEVRRELLRKPKTVDLRGELIRGVSPFEKVLTTLLGDAQKYDVPIKLTLLNATQSEINEILNHKDAHYIDDLDWTYEVRLIDDMEAYDLEDEKTGKDEEWTETPTGFTTDDSDEEWIDDVGFTTDDSDEEWIEDVGFTTDDSDEEWIDDVGFTTDDSDEEWIDDPIRLIGDDPDEEWYYDLLGFMRDDLDEELLYNILGIGGDDPAEDQIEDLVGLIGVEPHMPRLRRAVARARYVPALGELRENFGQKGIIAPPLRGIKNAIEDKDVLPEGNESPQLSGWNITLVKDAERNIDPNSPNSGQPTNLTRHVSHDLVRIFCQKEIEMARAG